ncbi:MAG: hypothetical protein JXA33_06580 [Anaerolineae bacterium]|nr:hypothetical protein [Anaerolineae bacterium]
MTDYTPFFEQNWALLQAADVYRPRPNPTWDNPVFEEASFRVLIVRLSPFRDVDRSTPHLFLFQAVRRAAPEAYVDMAFFPPQHDRARFIAARVPLLVGIQSWHGVDDFNLVLVSNAYTLELINLPYLLLHSGIPVWASQRDATYPPIILGGSNALATQAIITEAGDCVADAIFFGEGERWMEQLCRTDFRVCPPGRLESLSPLWRANSSGQVVEKAICPDPQASDLLAHYPLLNSAEAGTARVQINFGCPAFCSFCFEGYDRKPYREVAREEILAAARDLKQMTGATSLDLYSFNFNTHEEILALLLDLNRLFLRVGFKSQRVDILAAMPDLLEAEVIADKRSFTLGIEGISTRMRAFLHKSLLDAEIKHVLARLLRQKIREIKLFYILTGHEDEADVTEFRNFIRDLKNLVQGAGREGLRVIFSFGLLVRMPFTPLRYDRLFLDEMEWEPVIGPVKSACETNGFEFRLATPWDEYITSQILASGGYWLHEPVVALAEQGYCYDIALCKDGEDKARPYGEILQEWMQQHGLWNVAFLGEKDPEYDFPLTFVQQRISSDYLYRQYRAALEESDAGYCLGEVGQVAGEAAHCVGCGACVTVAQRDALTTHTMQHPGGSYLRELEDVMRAKWQLKPLYARVWIPPEVAGVEPEWLDAWLLREILKIYPDLDDTLLAVEESLFTTKQLRKQYTGMWGETVVAMSMWEQKVKGAREQGSKGAGGQRGKGTAPLPPCSLAPLLLRSSAPLHFLGWLDNFEPGMFERMEIELRLPPAHFPGAGLQLRQFLQAGYVPVNVRREEDGYCFDISKKALKKRVLFAGTYTETPSHFVARLTVSSKFDLMGYLRSFSEPGRWREASVEVIQIQY